MLKKPGICFEIPGVCFNLDQEQKPGFDNQKPGFERLPGLWHEIPGFERRHGLWHEIPGIWFWIPGICSNLDQEQKPGFKNQNPGFERRPPFDFFAIYCKFNPMPARREPLVKGNYYHIYNRGINRQAIFFSDRNYKFFVYKMREYFMGRAGLQAYCLMPNHYHILLRVEADDFVVRALHPFMVTYTKAVNHDQDRIGPLFQGRYQANLIGDEIQLMDCARYIHLNPVKAGLVVSPGKWDYSSYGSYLSPDDATFLDTSIVRQYFPSIDEFVDFSEVDNSEYNYAADEI